MRLVTIVLLAATTQACAGTHWHGPILVQNGSERPVSRETEVLTLEDLIGETKEPAEAQGVLRRSFSGDTRKYVTFRIDGSFTGAGRKQSMYSIGSDGEVQRTLVVYEAGSEVWRAEGEATAKRAVDVDGDGQDEWVETASSCRGDCTADAWIMRAERAGTKVLSSVPAALVSTCGEDGGEIKWTSLSLGAGGSEERREHRRDCR